MVENTPNHGLNKYASGDTDWTHSPDMQTIEERLVIRDVEENLQNYTAHATATFVATDTGAVYDGTGSSWEPANRGFETVATNSVETARVTATESITYPDGSVVTSPPGSSKDHDGIIRGYNGTTGSGSDAEANPSDYADASRAIQDVVDELESAQSGREQGVVYVPHTDPSGNPLTIPSTITFGNNGDTYPSFVGNTGRNGPYIEITIDDGSPAFSINNTKLNGLEIRGANVTAEGNDAEFIRFNSVTAFTYRGGDHRAFCGGSGSTAQGALVVDGQSWNSRFINPIFNGIGRSGRRYDVTGMNGIAFRDTLGGDPAGEFMIQGVSTYADPSYPMNSIIHSDANIGNIMVSNSRLEGAGGDGLIYGNAGTLHLSNVQFDRTMTGANRVNFSGYCFTMGTGCTFWSTADGTSLSIQAKRGYIPAIPTAGKSNGTPEFLEAGPTGGSSILVVPKPSTVIGSVSYDTSGGGLIHPDGTRP